MYRASNVTRRHVSNRLGQPDMAATRVVVSRFTTPPTGPSPPLMLMRHIKKKKRIKRRDISFLFLSFFLSFTSLLHTSPSCLYCLTRRAKHTLIPKPCTLWHIRYYSKPSICWTVYPTTKFMQNHPTSCLVVLLANTSGWECTIEICSACCPFLLTSEFVKASLRPLWAAACQQPIARTQQGDLVDGGLWCAVARCKGTLRHIFVYCFKLWRPRYPWNGTAMQHRRRSHGCRIE